MGAVIIFGFSVILIGILIYYETKYFRNKHEIIIVHKSDLVLLWIILFVALLIFLSALIMEYKDLYNV